MMALYGEHPADQELRSIEEQRYNALSGRRIRTCSRLVLSRPPASSALTVRVWGGGGVGGSFSGSIFHNYPHRIAPPHRGRELTACAAAYRSTR